jgi:hypothetical protein
VNELPDLAARYPRATLDERDRVATAGTFRERVRFDVVARPQHAFGLLAAADVASFVGVDEIVAIEFGVAEGAGLRNLAEIAAAVTAETNVNINLVGFDSGSGLPAPVDYRDHPEIWSEGDFAMGDPDALLAQLPPNVELVTGAVADTVAPFIETLSTPIGFVSFDLDLYSSTRDALALFGSGPTLLLPVVIAYFDDVIGGPRRIGSLFRNSAAGPLLAIEEFNRGHDRRRIDPIRILRYRRPLDRELWMERTYALHVLDHPARAAPAQRPRLSIAEHRDVPRYDWPL